MSASDKFRLTIWRCFPKIPKCDTNTMVPIYPIFLNFWTVRYPCCPRETVFFTSKRFGKETLPWIPV